jgi:hypothetical protein
MSSAAMVVARILLSAKARSSGTAGLRGSSQMRV